jgi:hypothetical protein
MSKTLIKKNTLFFLNGEKEPFLSFFVCSSTVSPCVAQGGVKFMIFPASASKLLG